MLRGEWAKSEEWAQGLRQRYLIFSKSESKETRCKELIDVGKEVLCAFSLCTNRAATEVESECPVS